MTHVLEKITFLICGGLFVLIFEHYLVTTVQELAIKPQQQVISSPTPKSISKLPRKGTSATVYRHDGREFELLPDFCRWCVPLMCVMLRTSSGSTPIHIHDPLVDIWVSKGLQNSGYWEKSNNQLMISELSKDPDLGFLDLGANVGAFTLTVAKFGRKVVSVDPLIENVQRLCKSVEKGGLSDKVTIIFNPLADEHTVVNFKREKGNVGGTSVVKNWMKSAGNPCEDSTDSKTAMLDDLIPLLPFSKAVLKIDVQEYEYIILKAAKRFFKDIHVTAILMEWVLLKEVEDGPLIIDLLTGYGFKAYLPTVQEQPLDNKDYKKWPFDILWRKKN